MYFKAVCVFVRLKFIGQQCFLTVQFELVDKNTREVALFFAYLRVW